MSNYDLVMTNIHGRMALDRESAQIIEDVAAQVWEWLEIGTLWGGSAILAALANPDLRIITIDPITGYYDRFDDPDANHMHLTASAILENFHKFGVAHRISIVKAKSYPWPLPDDFWVDAVFIDGDHSPEGVLRDWQNASRAARQFVLFHDYDDPHIRSMIDEHVDWNLYNKCERMAAFVRH